MPDSRQTVRSGGTQALHRLPIAATHPFAESRTSTRCDAAKSDRFFFEVSKLGHVAFAAPPGAVGEDAFLEKRLGGFEGGRGG